MKTINEHVLEIVRRAEGSKVALDLVLLIVVFGVLWAFVRKFTATFIALLVLFVIVYSANELMSTQRIAEQRVIGENGQEIVREVSVINSSTSPFALGFHSKLILSVPLIFTGLVQTINMVRGDRKYNLTKSLSTNLVFQGTQQTIYRTYMNTELPTKVIFVCQHLPYLFDTLAFHTFIPDTHKYTVFNDFTMGGMSDSVATAFHVLFCKHLYGAHKFSRRDKSRLKTQLTEFIDKMTVEPKTPEVFCIWPSGWAWDYTKKNGVDKFKPGTFFMSAFTGIPLCLVHGRLSKDSKRFIIEQSELIHPPTFDSSTKEVNYLDFYENQENKNIVEEYRARVENLYRETDDRLEREVNTIYQLKQK